MDAFSFSKLIESIRLSNMNKVVLFSARTDGHKEVKFTNYEFMKQPNGALKLWFTNGLGKRVQQIVMVQTVHKIGYVVASARNLTESSAEFHF